MSNLGVAEIYLRNRSLMVSENHFLQWPRKNTHRKQVHRCTEYVTFPALLLAYLLDFISYVHRFRGSLYKLLHHVDIQAFFTQSLLYICIASDLVPVFVKFHELRIYNSLELLHVGEKSVTFFVTAEKILCAFRAKSMCSLSGEFPRSTIVSHGNISLSALNEQIAIVAFAKAGITLFSRR